MPEREPTRIRITVTPDQLAPESIPALPQGEIIPVNPRQFDRLTTFRNMVKTVFQTEKEERENNNHPSKFGRIKDGTMVEPYMTLDTRYRAIWNEAACNMYETEILPDPEMKTLADGLVSQLKREYDGPPAMTSGELQTLFERE